MESQSTPSDSSAELQGDHLPIALEMIPTLHIRPKKGDVRLAFGSGIAYLALYFISQRIPFGQVAILIATLLSLGLVLLFTVASARALRNRRDLALTSLVSAALSLPSVLIRILFARFPAWTGWRTVGPGLVQYERILAHIPGLHGLMLILFATCLGVWLSQLLREMKILLPIALVLACVDLYVVFGGGLVAQAHTGKAPAAQAAMKSLTVPLTSHPKSGAAPIQLAVGFADFLFIALFFACFARFGVPSGRTFKALCALLLVYMGIVYVTGLDLPALVPIAIVVVGMNLRQFRYERSEAFALLYAGLIVAAIMGGFLFMSHH
jgi:hypothetical protein